MSNIAVSIEDVSVAVEIVGSPGKPGLSGARPMELVDFPAPTSTWIIDMGQPCDVVVINSANQVVWPGDMIYGPGTQITLVFSAPFSGQAQCFF